MEQHEIAKGHDGPHNDGGSSWPQTQATNGSFNLGQFRAAMQSASEYHRKWARDAADEIERLRDRNAVLADEIRDLREWAAENAPGCRDCGVRCNDCKSGGRETWIRQ